VRNCIRGDCAEACYGRPGYWSGDFGGPITASRRARQVLSILLAIVTLGVLCFIHHVSESIPAPNVITAVGHHLDGSIVIELLRRPGEFIIAGEPTLKERM
jgi:uncharacterized membrane protein